MAPPAAPRCCPDSSIPTMGYGAAATPAKCASWACLRGAKSSASRCSTPPMPCPAGASPTSRRKSSARGPTAVSSTTPATPTTCTVPIRTAPTTASISGPTTRFTGASHAFAASSWSATRSPSCRTCRVSTASSRTSATRSIPRSTTPRAYSAAPSFTFRCRTTAATWATTPSTRRCSAVWMPKPWKSAGSARSTATWTSWPARSTANSRPPTSTTPKTA